MTNLEYLKSITDIKEFAENRLDVISGRWYGDYGGFTLDKNEAIEEEIEWLNQEHKED